jgi:hypothetical protein
MKRAWPLILTALFISEIANAGETKILYYQDKIPGPQITKDFYVKESLKKDDPKNPNLICPPVVNRKKQSLNTGFRCLFLLYVSRA